MTDKNPQVTHAQQPQPYDIQPLMEALQKPEVLSQVLTTLLSDPTLLPIEFKTWLPTYTATA